MSATIIGEYKTIEIALGNGQRESVSPGEWGKAEELGVGAIATEVWTPEVLAAWAAKQSEPA